MPLKHLYLWKREQPAGPPVLPAPYLQDLWAGEVVGDVGDGQPVLDIGPGKENTCSPALPLRQTPIWCMLREVKTPVVHLGDPQSF